MNAPAAEQRQQVARGQSGELRRANRSPGFPSSNTTSRPDSAAKPRNPDGRQSAEVQPKPGAAPILAGARLVDPGLPAVAASQLGSQAHSLALQAWMMQCCVTSKTLPNPCIRCETLHSCSSFPNSAWGHLSSKLGFGGAWSAMLSEEFRKQIFESVRTVVGQAITSISKPWQ